MSSSPPPAGCSTTRDSSASMSRGATTPMPTSTTRSAASHRSRRATASRRWTSRRRATRPSRRHDSPRRRWCGGSRSWGWDGPPPTPRSLTTIQDRGYVWKKGSALVPTWTAFAAVSLLESHFPTLVDYEFTARMEDELDRIAAGDEESVPWLSTVLLRRRGPATDGGVVLRRHRRPPGQLDRGGGHARGHAGHRPGRAIRALPRAGRRSRHRYPRTSPQTS